MTRLVGACPGTAVALFAGVDENRALRVGELRRAFDDGQGRFTGGADAEVDLGAADRGGGRRRLDRQAAARVLGPEPRFAALQFQRRRGPPVAVWTCRMVSTAPAFSLTCVSSMNRIDARLAASVRTRSATSSGCSMRAGVHCS